ncbi:MAG: NAD(P)H-dependent glycerol-3-phosphate dehydrogenase [Candidatus Tectimicrobiota bacterium]
MTEPIAVVGAGSWGTTLAIHLAERGHPVTLWAWEPDLAEEMAQVRENRRFLPGYPLPETITPTNDLSRVAPATTVLSAVPSFGVRAVLRALKPHLAPSTLLITATKGIEEESLQTVGGILVEEIPPAKRRAIVALSGPSFAKEVVRKLPTAVVAASIDIEGANAVQRLLNTSTFRVYTNRDIIGVELAGAFKNVVAIACGVSDGLELGFSARSALIARGLAEMSRLGVAMGGEAQTFAGLAGLGDLVLTCTGALSRNRTVGMKIGQGLSLEAILKDTDEVAEGVKTTPAIVALGAKYGVELPIAEQVAALLYRDKAPAVAVEKLMTRVPKAESD